MSNTNRPQAWIVSPRDNGRRAIKHRNGKQVIFLKDKEEYGFELYNPTSERYAVSIDIDGKPISTSMIVLEPGVRQYLNCYIDSKRKFVFSTYEVEDTQEVDRSIANNGKVDIRFHRENVLNYNTITYPNIFCGSFVYNTLGNYIPPTTTNLYYSDAMSTSVNTIDVSNTTKKEIGKTEKNVLNSFETTRTTGRTTQGEMTDTVFNDYHGNFNYYASYTTNYWIEPDVNVCSGMVTDDWLREQLSVKFIEDKCDNCKCGENKCKSNGTTDYDKLDKKLNILERLKHLNTEGILTDTEYNNKRAEIVSQL